MALQKGERADNVENELAALHRAMFAARSSPDLFTVATFVDGDLAGFSVNEVLHGGYAIVHFEKADASYVGVYAHLMQRTAWLLAERGCHSLNYEQDLGVFGLRKGKKSYLPQSYLRKYALKAASAAAASELEELSSRFLTTASGAALPGDLALRPPPLPAPQLLLACAAPEAQSPGLRAVTPPLGAPADPLDLPPLSRARVEPPGPHGSGEWLSLRSAPPPPRSSPTLRAPEPPAADLDFAERADPGPPTARSLDALPRALRRVSRAPIPREEPDDPPPARLDPASGAAALRAG